MSTELSNPPADTNGHDRKLPPGVRAYRGRKLEDLIPQIRADLGPDAIILRQREGLTGGVGGFFAQRCVEVEAQAMQRVDVYDDHHDDEPAESPRSEEPLGRPQQADYSADLAGHSAELAEHTTDLPESSAELAEHTADLPEPSTELAEHTADLSEPSAELAEPQVAPVAHSAAPTAAPESPMAALDTMMAGLPAAYESFAARLEQAAAQGGDVNELLAAAGTTALPEPVAAPEPVPLVSPEPVLSPEPVTSPVPPVPLAISGIPPAQRAWAAKQASYVDPAEAAAVARELTSQGISDTWADELVVAAAAHRWPLMRAGSLRDAVRSTLAATIPAPAPLPASGAVIAFVGAGGAGKTHCAAALAAAYARAGTLAASVVAVGSGDWGAELKELLKTQNVWVTAVAHGIDAAPTVAAARDCGLVVIDTVAATPGDTASVEALAAELEPLVPDAVYIAVPATFSVHAARKLVDSFEPLGADGITVTHGDAADQIGVAAELAYVSGMPIAYIHEGVELDKSLSAADPASLAARLLP